MQKSRAAIHKKHLASACAVHRYPVTLIDDLPLIQIMISLGGSEALIRINFMLGAFHQPVKSS